MQTGGTKEELTQELKQSITNDNEIKEGSKFASRGFIFGTHAYESCLLIKTMETHAHAYYIRLILDMTGWLSLVYII